MKRLLPLFFVVFSVEAAFSQCLNITATANSVSCYNGGDGQIVVTVTQGVGPFTYELYLFRPGVGQNPMGSVTTSSSTVTFQKGNGTLSALFENVGIHANASLSPAGNEYRVFVSASGASGDPFCETLGINGLIVTEPPQLSITLNDTDPDCDPAPGIGVGKIDLTVSGGAAPYTITWTGPSAVPDGTTATGSVLDAGTYTVSVTDANNCTHALNVDVPVATQADAGPPTGITCGVNSFALSGNTPGGGEIGIWTGPPGVTFSPHVNAPNATANNLGPGVNVLRWRIADSGGICTGTYDEIAVTMSPGLSLASTVTNVLCHGASTGAIDINIAGGISPFTYAWSTGAVTQDITNLPAGVYSVTVTDAASCTAVLNNITVSEPAEVVGATTSETDVLCFGASTGAITVTGTGGVGPYDFSNDGGLTYAILNQASYTFASLIADDYDIVVRDANGCISTVIPVTLTQPASAVSGSTSQTDVTCFGANTGEIIVTATGGVGPYDFSNNGGLTYAALAQASYTFTGLIADDYDIVIRDANGCTSTVIPVTITQPAAGVNGSTSKTDVACFGGTTGAITVTGAGGLGPYDFSNDGGLTYAMLDQPSHTFTGLVADDYDIVIRDANGCTSTVIPVTISQPAAVVSGDIGTTDVTCFGATTGTITVAGTGGVGPYDFSNDGGLTYAMQDQASHTFIGLAANNYGIVVRDANGCVSTIIPVTITQPAAVVSGNTSKNDVTCFGASTGTITVTGTGGVGPYDFSNDGGLTYAVQDQASHTFTGLMAGDYDIVVRDANGCVSAFISLTITQPAAVVSGTTSKTDVTCFGASTGTITVTGTGGVGPYDFSNDGGLTYAIEDQVSHTFTGLVADDYDVVVRDANGCVSTVIPVTLTQPAAGVNGSTSKIDVTCFGASTGAITVTGTGGVGLYDFSADGGLTYAMLNQASHTFTGLAADDYDIVVRDANGCVSAVIPVAITQPAAVVANTSKIDVACFGASTGEITVTGSGGVGPYDFSNDGGLTFAIVGQPSHTFSGLAAGDYEIVVRDASGCVSTVVTVTLTEAPAASIDAGAAQEICTGETVQVNATFTGATSVIWTTSGNGTFNNATLVNPVYTPGPGDLSAMSVTLTATTVGPCTPVSDNVVITIKGAPVVDAGATQTICSNASVVLSGSFSGTATGLIWSTSGDGTFSDVTDPDATYTPGSLDSTNQSVTLRATATGSCPGVFDEVIIAVNRAASVDVGGPQTVCVGSNVSLNAILGGSATSVTWTSSGSGTFANAGNPVTTYTPSAADLANGTVTLTAVTNNPPGPCPSHADNVVISFIPIPGDQITAGIETWIGYVYDDSGDPTPIPAKIDFDNSKYRGFVNETDIASMSPAAAYDVATDTFDLDLDMTHPFQGTNVCGSYLNNFSVRYKMDKTFDEGVYRFTVGSDDGVRLLIDGVEVLPAAAFGLHAYTEYTSAPYCLTAGVHSLEIQYFENNGSARLSFSYEAVPELILSSPVAVCMNSPSPALTVSSTDADVVDFNWYKNGVLVFTGALYTPAAAELDMSTVGTTTFSVAAVYGCGETPPVEVVVEVFDEAVLALSPQTICEAGGSVDLRTLVTAVPAGGTFTFSGDPHITGDFFDPTGLAGSTASILVDYAIGSCSAPQATLDLTVTNTATVTAPLTPVLVCESMTAIDLTTLVSAGPAGGTFVFSGPQVTGNTFDPSSLSGIQTITVDYNVGGCAAPQTTFDIDVTGNATITANTTTACENGSPVNLLTRVSAMPAGGTFTFTGTGVSGSLFDPSVQTGTVNINVSYDLNGCTANATLQIDVLDATNGLCAAGNCATVVIVPQVFPATCTNSDGRMIMDITPPTPVVNNTGVKMTIQGVSSTGLVITRTNFNDPVFNNLPVGNYDYTIEYGDPSCIKTGIFSIDQSGTVGTPVVSNVVSPLCAGTATGSLTLDVPGETGNILEWSLDGGLTDPFKPFVAGSKITSIPAGPAPTFQQVISVRRNASDVCFSSITVTIPESVSPITATFAVASATCNGNDGAVTNIVADGGHGAPFSYSIDGGLTFQPGTAFNGLAGGSYTLRVRDAGGCERDFVADVTFPGFINSVISKNNADCSNDGSSGSISVAVNDAGAFEVALTTDQFTSPAERDYRPYSIPSVTFNNLARGEYYVYVRSASGACPTRSAPIRIFGVYDINFDISPNCDGTDLSITLTNVTGEIGGAPLEIQVFKRPDINVPYDTIFRQFPANGEIFLSKNDPEISFLKTPGDYRIMITQFQSEVICNLTSDVVDFRVPEPLSAQVVFVSNSYPDVPTGQLRVSAVSGGVNPFDVRIELDSAASYSLPFYQTQFEEAGLNANQQIEMRYNNVPAGRYRVEVMDSMGCLVDLTARVPLNVDLFIPNVFTPNGDGSNDVFFIRNLPQEPAANTLIISNRWGKQIFTSENYQNNWDGEGVADGIYFYRLQVADSEPLTGWIEIMRGQKP